MLDDKIDGGAKPYIFSEDTSIDPKSFLVIPRSKSKIVLANAGGEVNLLWYNGKNISKVIYNTAKEGRSYAFIGGSWQWTDSPSTGKENTLAKAEPAAPPKRSEPVLSSKTEETVTEMPAQIFDSVDEEQNIEEYDQVSDETFLEEEAVEEVVPEDTEIAGAELKNPKNSEPVNSESVNNIKNSGQAEEKNNPWFLGDMALSAMSLFLVWRYQSLKKKVK